MPMVRTLQQRKMPGLHKTQRQLLLRKNQKKLQLTPASLKIIIFVFIRTNSQLFKAAIASLTVATDCAKRSLA